MASIRKHVSQMSEKEQEFILDKAKEIKNWKISKHLLERIEERGGDKSIIAETLQSGDLIEYHQKDGVSRFLIRGTKLYYKYVACLVFQYENEKVITLYWNVADDHHRTLKEELYDEKVDVVGLYKAEQRLPN